MTENMKIFQNKVKGGANNSAKRRPTSLTGGLSRSLISHRQACLEGGAEACSSEKILEI